MVVCQFQFQVNETTFKKLKKILKKYIQALVGGEDQYHDKYKLQYTYITALCFIIDMRSCKKTSVTQMLDFRSTFYLPTR